MGTNYSQLIDRSVFHLVGNCADEMGRECYVVGGYVRDLILKRHSKDIDFVTVGSGIEVATAVGKKLHTRVNVFRKYGTAQVKRGEMELEFVGARRESYQRDSRNPIVEDGTLDDDIARRDFTINAMALCVNSDRFGELVDRYDGIGDIERKIIRTPLDPDITFSDDPLRMMRAIRFATQLNFDIYPETFEAIKRNAYRIEIISRERIADELNKIMKSAKPSIGWELLLQSGLLKLIFPQLDALKGVDVVKGRGHKDNFYHTLQVLDTVAGNSEDLWLRWAALLHDIAKPVTKRWDDAIGWTFHNHNFVGAKMIPDIFRQLKLPLNEHMRYVQKLVELHMRPIALVEDIVTDSAVRRLINYAGPDLADLMILAKADITSRNEEKKNKFLANFELVEEKFKDIDVKDYKRTFKPSVSGDEIMRIFNIPQGKTVGYFMDNLKKAQLDVEIPHTREAALEYLYQLAEKIDLKPVNPPEE
jgi:poly(A) polymerase